MGSSQETEPVPVDEPKPDQHDLSAVAGEAAAEVNDFQATFACTGSVAAR